MPSLPVHISGITVRNLKNISIEFLPGEIVLLTGVSGSGKSSLAFDTVYAAGRKRYVATLPAFFATNLSPLPDPTVEKIHGLSPTIAVKQNHFAYHAHSTVGSAAELSQHLALLFSLDGEARDPHTKQTLHLQSKEKILATLATIPEGTQVTILAPLINISRASIQECVRQGYTKIRIDNVISSIYPFLTSPLSEESPVAIVVDSFIKNESNNARMKVSLFSALDLGQGKCSISTETYEETFSTQVYIPETQQTYAPLTPQVFSPHSLEDRCTQCQGSGIYITIDDPSLIQNDLSIRENCCKLAGNCSTYFYHALYQSLADTLNFSLDTPWKDLPDSVQNAFLYGQKHLVLPVRLFDPTLGKKPLSHKVWRGILNEIGEKVRYAAKPSKYIPEGTSATSCPTCQGTGIGEYACAATWQGKTFVEFQKMPLDEFFSFTSSITPTLPSIREVLDGLNNRLSILINLGLSYLTPERTLATLSGGEQERTALAKHLGAELSGITYILDEPSIGLHPRDTHKLIQVIQKLRDQGNTILLVEHDEQMISFADRIIDIGPGAGIFGGEVLFNGTPADFLKTCDSLTASYLRHELTIDIPVRRPKTKARLTLSHATINNLKDITISLPLERITAVTGVSGSGKSSLINDTLVPAMERVIQGDKDSHLCIEEGTIERVVHITRDLPGRSQRSISLTYIKAFDDLRELFSQQPKSKRLGLTKGHFSFNLSLGACTECQGIGSITLDNHTPIPCPLCHGKRFQPQILEVRYQGKNIADILAMTAYEAEKFFMSTPHIHEKIHALCSLGLDHLPLGRPLSSLSGGEIQRLKLTYELLAPSKKPTLYILDEPTTGLHTHDIHALIHVLQSLTQQGHTVVVIEHNMHIVKIADYVIELGPEGGNLGGYLLASCTPEELISLNTPTAKALQPYFKKTKALPKLAEKSQNRHLLKDISIQNAYHHNLKHIDITLPRNALTAISGPSASGKHSLVFDILYAAGNIAYAELFPYYVRQALIKQTPLPQVESVRGLSPVVAIKKTGIRKNSRYSLASSLDITNGLEKLFALLGKPHCPLTGKPLKKITPQTIIDKLFQNYENSYVTITAPISPEEDLSIALEMKKKEGYLKLFANNEIYDLGEHLPEILEDPAIIIQHTKISKSHESSLLSSLTLAFSLSRTIRLHIHNQGKIQHSLSYTLGWQDSLGNSYPNITRKLLSREHSEGQCQQCCGSGNVLKLSLTAHKDKILHYSPLDLFKLFFPDISPKRVVDLIRELKISSSTQIQDLDPPTQEKLFQGTQKHAGLERILMEQCNLVPFCPLLHPLILSDTCSGCSGWGIHTYAQQVRIGETSLIDIYQEDTEFLKNLLMTLHDDQAQPIIQDLQNRLAFIDKVGLSYITLGQQQDTLSDGEHYRLHLAKKISTNLTDIVYLLEDPLSGLHPQDIPTLTKLLKELVTNNNTVIATDRNHLLELCADHTINLGPGSGPQGGYLTNPLPSSIEDDDHKKVFSKDTLEVRLSIHNISNLHVQAPLYSLVAIAGVSGSGKTSLLTEGFYKQAQKLIDTGNAHFSNVVFLDSHPLSSSQRSDISTYFDIAPYLRNFYASLTQAKALNITASMLSTNTKHGQCSDCLGLGYHLIDRAFYALEKRTCPTCSGYRIQPLSQEVVYEGKHFGKLLKTPIEEVLTIFPFLKRIQAPLQALIDSGLGYLPLGQNLSSLSLSEKISVKIARFLHLAPQEPSLFLLDEIATSLDVNKKCQLQKLFRTLISQGHSIIYVDHDIQLLKHADYIIELGPGSGKYGGKVLFSGQPKDLATSKKSVLKTYMSGL
ncbi:excinuclease ABC subunit UvrA [Chlamydia caviae]|uniref:UvrABC system protein A n=1 Tax=Chlamydia caviae (strain ATCC VR-813 / DSM 19441 / 03DC25 / GPIC) TaxID=227941 RepID=Q822K6_CHLCV|nr:excinuclease ABC subunit UvrA [Chlamydia caviae]AAP05418.1 excinuclease ABC, subunit A [Chlamydia caviae GPIC]